MKGDFTRLTFRPTNHYSSVRLQQGRVQLDADWNEQVDIQAHRDETATHDVVGPCGAPFHEAGFAVTISSPTSDILVPPGTIFIGPGRYYVNGILCENEQAVAFTAQSDLPGASLPEAAGLYFAYLDVWQRHITALDDPTVREMALGGPDTATRTKTVWQVKLMEWLETAEGPDLAVSCSDWTPPDAQSTGQLRARARPESAITGPCIVPAGAGFRRLENQLYRVEIHKRGDLNTATFKWSRDNGSIVVSWLAQTGNDLTVSSLGRDRTLGFASGQWVELTDDTRELQGEPGTLVRLVKAEGQVLTIDPATATGSVNRTDFPRNPKVRRWDSAGALKVEVPVTNDDWIPLEDGVEVKFEAGSYQTGDYWLTPARTATVNPALPGAGDVEWPRDAANNPLPQPKHGIHHRYCPLAVLLRSCPEITSDFSPARNGSKYEVILGQVLRAAQPPWTLISDCRKLFPPVTELTSFFYVSGDGQEAMPGQALPKPLQVGVANGQWPVAGARVRFRITAGNGTLTAGGTTGTDIIVPTGLTGVAECTWQLDATTQSQQVEATLLDDAGRPVHLPVRFTANLSVAKQVAYDPTACPNLTGVNTVQGAIDRLCQMGGGQEPGVRIIDVSLSNDTDVRVVDILAQGILVTCDNEIDPTTISQPTCFVTLDMPVFGQPPVSVRAEENTELVVVPLNPDRAIGYQPLVLAGDVSVHTQDPNAILWKPRTETAAWLSRQLPHLFADGDRGILAHLTLKGNFIWAAEDPTLYLDGEAFGAPPGQTYHNLRLPSGDGRRGGDFETWFWLAPLLKSVTLNPSTVIAGNISVGTVTLSSPAPAGGTLVSLSSSNTVGAAVPPNVTVEEGKTTATFQVRAQSVTGLALVVITASLGHFKRKATLTVRPPKGKEKEKDKEIEAKGVEGPALTLGDPASLIGLPSDPADDHESRLATGQAFIRPEERPPLGEEALSQPDEEPE